MPKKYIGKSFDTLGDESCSNATISLVGSHLQNICVEVESDAVEMSFIVSPVAARKLIDALQVALTELKQNA